MLSLAASRHQQFLLYLAVGLINAIFTFFVFFFLTNILFIHYLAALLAAFLSGNLLTYLLNHRFVFLQKQQFTFRRLPYFLVGNSATFIVNLILLGFLVEVFGLTPLLSQILLMPALVFANFIITKFWSMRSCS